MNDHQLLCFLTVSRTLNFTTAARELYCTQPALSYQIRSLEKELDLALFERSTTRVALTEAGRAFVPQAEGIYRSILNARTALKGFARRRTLTLRDDPRPEIQQLREVFTAVYASRAKLLGEE